MPQLFDLGGVRARLERDRTWAAFSIADLEPPYSQHAAWFGDPMGRSVVLVYDAFRPPILYLQGHADDCDRLLAEHDVVSRTSRAYLNVVPDLARIIRRRFQRFDERAMVRMVLSGDLTANGITPVDVIRLGPNDLDRVRALYADEQPAFFLPDQLRSGVYFGACDDEGLLAVAGTHVVSRAGSVAAIGNVYTRPESRGRGLAAAVTRAVAGELRAMGIRTIVLNIVETNDAARRVYERLGFREYCRFLEGEATR